MCYRSRLLYHRHEKGCHYCSFHRYYQNGCSLSSCSITNGVLSPITTIRKEQEGRPISPADGDNMYSYPDKYICLDCRIQWGHSKTLYNRYDRYCNSYGPKGLHKSGQRSTIFKPHEFKIVDDDDYNPPRCRKCGKEGVHVSKDFRAPKQKDKKQWKILKRFIENGDQDIKKFTLKSTFTDIYIERVLHRLYNYPNIFLRTIIPSKQLFTHEKKSLHRLYFKTCHTPYRKSEMDLIFPTKMSEYWDFIEKLAQTRNYFREIPSPSNDVNYDPKKLAKLYWNVLRIAVKIRCLLEWWSGTAHHKKRMKLCTDIIQYLPPIILTFPGGIEYKKAENEFNNLKIY